VIFLILTHDFGITLEEYAARGKKNDFPGFDRCPGCRGALSLLRHGFYWRNAIGDKAEYRIPVCRLKCPSCKKTFSLLPSFLLPYFQYTVDVILDKIRASLVGRVVSGYHQLALFYRKRFFRQLTQVEMFFRDEGFRGVLPGDLKQRAIKLLEMISAFGKATFVRRSRGHFSSNFMAF